MRLLDDPWDPWDLLMESVNINCAFSFRPAFDSGNVYSMPSIILPFRHSSPPSFFPSIILPLHLSSSRLFFLFPSPLSIISLQCPSVPCSFPPGVPPYFRSDGAVEECPSIGSDFEHCPESWAHNIPPNSPKYDSTTLQNGPLNSHPNHSTLWLRHPPDGRGLDKKGTGWNRGGEGGERGKIF